MNLLVFLGIWVGVILVAHVAHRLAARIRSR